MQRWKLVNIFDSHKHDVFLMIITMQLSALTARNKHTFTPVFTIESSLTVILKDQICVIMSQTLAFDHSPDK